MKRTSLFITIILLIVVIGCSDHLITKVGACDPDPDNNRDGLWDRSTCPHHSLADSDNCDLEQCHVGPRESTCNVGQACHNFFFKYCEPGAPRKDHSGTPLSIQTVKGH